MMILWIASIVILIGTVVLCIVPFKSIWSPLTMLTITLVTLLTVNPIFEKSEVLGYLTLGFVIFYYICLVKSIKLYFKENKL